ncbi:stigma-specific STIG1-like protein 3 [Cryptomeria japonica]|uniref:stigma-specific STIG1-like protein 3 n=1 Tax=Cryptomeria japonica TaxID=3369 RepID=UPI0027DA5143|nr:stigma-specific STIG1-like protein 3 [Cryptomeria japonica]
MALLIIAVIATIISNAEGEMATPYSRRVLRSRFLTQQISAKSVSCSEYKDTCKKNNIAGKNKSMCCENRCYNLLIDRNHCGSCGAACKFGYTCCNGKCVDLAKDKKHCGSCGVSCPKKKKCNYAMCSYA